VVTQLSANPKSGRAPGTQTNFKSTNSSKTLNSEMEDSDLLQNRVLSGITNPSQVDTYNKNKNSQTHWNRLTEWIALSNIFPVSPSLFSTLKLIRIWNSQLEFDVFGLFNFEETLNFPKDPGPPLFN
jgi:hypothetical protein